MTPTIFLPLLKDLMRVGWLPSWMTLENKVEAFATAWCNKPTCFTTTMTDSYSVWIWSRAGCIVPITKEAYQVFEVHNSQNHGLAPTFMVGLHPALNTEEGI